MDRYRRRVSRICLGFLERRVVNNGARELSLKRWEVHMSREAPTLEQRGVDFVPKDERTVGFWDLFVLWAGFSIIMTSPPSSTRQTVQATGSCPGIAAVARTLGAVARDLAERVLVRSMLPDAGG